MITDARQVAQSHPLFFDVCIIGGGAAGITLAIELAERGTRVVLLEGGGLSPDPMTQELYVGENLGLTRERLSESRSRYLGGSTNCWGGWCRPLDDIDFEARPWIADSGWPITKAALAPYYRRSQAWLQLPELGYDLSDWREGIAQREASLLPIERTGLQNVLSQLSPPTRYGMQYRERLSSLPNLTVMLFANAARILTNETASNVTGIEVKTLNGNRFTVGAKYFTLASGGIENARLLLLSNQVQTAGLGNGHDVVGRYYMDHPRVKSHLLRVSDAKRYRTLYDATLHRIHTGRGAVSRDIEIHLAPTFEQQRLLELSNSRTYLVARYSNDLTKSFFALKALQRAISGRSHFGYPRSRVFRDVVRQLPTLLLNAPTTALTVADVRFNSIRTRNDYSLETVFEPVPNRQSRVTLSARADALGLRQAVVDWRLTDQDRDNFQRQTQLVLDGLVQMEVVQPSTEGRVRETIWPDDVMGCWHHMGTTRMSDDPARGVVNADCRVHGIHNLYIAGSSVFPTVGSDSPTITIVALALRLADRISMELARPEVVTAGQARSAA
ncbi:GMC oxidoreductase [Devosia sp.]|uniref:GMC oxidoreductase n=1 Tax=Devosia sp. TaxID=1871048 RepID=UPI0019E9A296|nr:GMC family oxidoreductase [Devosia sp.]MBE0579715.1 GMC family oxidoreductase [Devosia sp.]